MSRIARHQDFRLLTLLLLSVGFITGVTSCDEGSRRFKMEARFSQIDQGEFYLYSPDETIQGIDTIRLQGGRFVYSLDCQQPGVLMLVFPNYSEQPVFVEPGKEVKIKGDVTHLKEMKVTGTRDNKLMNGLREVIAKSSPLEMIAHARRFIEEHPASAVSSWLVTRYFLQGDSVDYSEAYRLVNLMREQQPDNYFLLRLEKQMSQLAASDMGQPLPVLQMTDLDGKTVSTKNLAPLTIVQPWASWNNESITLLRQLNSLARRHRDRLQVLAPSLDGSKDACRNIVERDTLDNVTIICDERMFESPVVQEFGLYSLTDNVVCKNGRVQVRNLSKEELVKRIREAE